MSAPVLIVTPRMGAREYAALPGSAALDALVNLAHRCACEAACGHWTATEASRGFMERETGRDGWRAFLSPETAHAVEAVEAAGWARFVHEDEV